MKMARKKQEKPTTLRMPVVTRNNKLVKQHAVLPQYPREKAERLSKMLESMIRKDEAVLVPVADWLPPTYTIVDTSHPESFVSGRL